MQYKKIECQNYNVHLIQNKGFHNIKISINFTEEINKKKNNYRIFLSDILVYGTKKYDKPSKLIKKCQELYSSYPSTLVVRYGKYIRTIFELSILDSIYIDKENIIESIKLLNEIVFNPLTNNKKFTSNYFDTLREELKKETLGIKENSRVYANIKLLQLFKENDYISLTGYCDLDFLDNLNETNLYESYLEMIKNSKIDIIISGDLGDQNKIIEAIKKIVVINNSKVKLPDPEIVHDDYNKKEEYFKEKYQGVQSKISLGFKIANTTDYERKYVLNILNVLLGGSASSLLMKYVREENNLCYYIGCYYNKLDNILVINSAIDKENYQKVIEIIKGVFDLVEKGNFSLKELENAKRECIISCENLKENNHNLGEYYYGKEVFNTADVERRIEFLRKVSKEDIMKVASKIKLSKCFFLEGDIS